MGGWEEEVREMEREEIERGRGSGREEGGGVERN